MLSDVLDDEVVDTVYQYRDVELDLGPVSELTKHTFGAVVKGTDITVVLFFVRCKWLYIFNHIK